jgi:small ligand-binding sensory domain FIST
MLDRCMIEKVHDEHMFHKVSHGHILVFVFGKGYRIIGACLFDDSMAEEMMQVVRIS